MKHRVDRKILLDVVNLWSRVDRNIPVSLWGKIHACVRKTGVSAPLSLLLHGYIIHVYYHRLRNFCRKKILAISFDNEN